MLSSFARFTMFMPTRATTVADFSAIFSRSFAFPSRICLALSSFFASSSSSCSKIRSKPFSISSMGLLPALPTLKWIAQVIYAVHCLTGSVEGLALLHTTLCLAICWKVHHRTSRWIGEPGPPGLPVLHVEGISLHILTFPAAYERLLQSSHAIILGNLRACKDPSVGKPRVEHNA